MKAHATGHLKVTSSKKAWAHAVGREYCTKLNSDVRRRLNRVATNIQEIVEQAILDSPEVKAISTTYQGEFGIANPEQVFAEIAKVVAGTVKLTFKPFRATTRGSVSGSITLTGAPIDVGYLTSHSFAHIVSENGHDFSWLEALLTKGDEVIVSGYSFSSRVLNRETIEQHARVPNAQEPGLMLPVGKRSWRVPPEVSGTETDNLLTRAIAEPSIQNKITRHLHTLIS